LSTKSLESFGTLGKLVKEGEGGGFGSESLESLGTGGKPRDWLRKSGKADTGEARERRGELWGWGW
jgi:hypothetical protein